MNDYTGPVAGAKAADVAPAPEASAEAYPKAAAILRDAGWGPHPDWSVYTRGTLVMALQPDGATFHVKDWAMIQPGHPKYGPDTPDTAEEAAAWLVARFGAPLDQGGELGESAGDDASADSAIPVGSNDDPGENAGIGEVDVESGGPDMGPSDPIDAEFYEPEPEPDLPALEGEDLNAPALPEPESLGEEILATEEQGGVAYFGDNLPTMRLKKLGRLAQIAAERIAVITSEIGWDDEEFDRLQGYVVRQTVGGTFSGDQAQYDRFVSMSQAWGHIRAIQRHRDNGTVFLNAASREEVEGFDPEAGWPQ